MTSPPGNGSVSQFSPSGAPISGPLGYQGGPVRAQGTVPDAHGNIQHAEDFLADALVFYEGLQQQTSSAALRLRIGQA